MADGWGGPRSNSGGKRKGAGRKAKLATEIRAKAIEEAGEDASYALGLVVSYMRDDELPLSFRRGCAEIVMDRVWGKPKQAIDHSGTVGVTVVDARNKLAGLLARTVGQAAADATTGDSEPAQPR